MEFVHESIDYDVTEIHERFHNDLPKIVMVTQGFFGEIIEDTFDRTEIKHFQTLLFDTDMEFVYEQINYDVAKFHERFQNDLPQIVIVTQGFCGKIIEDTFDREHVLRVHVVSKQKRVVAKFQYKNDHKLISIPATYGEKLCVVKKGGKLGKPKEIFNIQRDNIFPLTVEFPKDHCITVGNQTVGTNNIPRMELQQTFDEVYLLSNFITDGVINPEIVMIPLYLSQLRLAVITGIKGKTEEDWKAYQLELNHAAFSILFDNEYGNPNIAEYDPKAVHTDTTYSYIEPSSYSNFVRLMNKSTLTPNSTTILKRDLKQQKQCETGSNIYEEIDNTAREKQTKEETYEKLNKPQMQTTPLSQKTQDSTPPLPDRKTHPLMKNLIPPPLAPKPHRRHKNDEDLPPALPERSAINGLPFPLKQAAQAMYQNDVPRTKIMPTMNNVANREPEQFPKDTKNEMSAKLEQKSLQNEGVYEKVREVKSHDDVKELNIFEVAEYLKRLHLETYAETFKNEQIDGRMLIQLDKEMLKEDFDMKGIEALRLITFAKEGHVPN